MSLRRDTTEALTNMIVGALINCGAVLLLFGVSISFATLTTLIFFGLSFIRSFFIRRLFRWRESIYIARQ